MARPVSLGPKLLDMAMLHRALIIVCLAAGLTSGCGPRDAQPADMHAAASACGIQEFAVTASRMASQTPYMLWVRRSDDHRPDVGCYQSRLEADGLRRTLVLSSPQALDEHDGLFFNRVSDTCDLPLEAIFIHDDRRAILLEAGQLSEDQRLCAAQQVRTSGRFDDVEFSNESAPDGPTIAF